MSDHYQIRSSLEDLSLRHVREQLHETCRHLQELSEQQSILQVLTFAKQKIRPYYMRIPSYLRSKIIKNTLKMQRSSIRFKHARLYLMALLLNSDISDLKITICCSCKCRYQSFFLQLLASEGIGLESLNLTRSSLLNCNHQLFSSTLLNMKNLSSLTLRDTASDDMLKVIGINCTKLVSLDVAYSKKVTDRGLKQLLLVKRRELSPVSSQRQTEAYKHWLPFQRLCSTLAVNWNYQFVRPTKPILFEYYKNRNLLCDTLKVLNITETRTTYASVLLALINVPQLESLTDDAKIAKIIIFMNENKFADFLFPCSLTEMRIHRPKFTDLKILAQACPMIKKLHISDPIYIFPDMLRILPHITSLIIHEIPVEEEWINTFYNYLQINGQNLYKIDLRVSRRPSINMSVLPIDMREIFINCPNLRTLITCRVNMIWTEGCNPLPLIYLRKVQLLCRVPASIIIKLLSVAPELIILYIEVLFSSKEELNNLLNPPIKSGRNRVLNERDNGLQNLIGFTISYIEPHVVSTTTVLNMLYNCTRLRLLGHLRNWCLDNEDIDMLQRTFPDVNIIESWRTDPN